MKQAELDIWQRIKYADDNTPHDVRVGRIPG